MRDCLVAHHCDELILHLEEEFAVALAEDELAPLDTVQQLCQLIVRKANHPPSRLLAFAFNQIRNALAVSLNIPRSSIWPSTPLVQLFQPSRRSRLWRQAADHTGVRFPALLHSQQRRHLVHQVALALAACLIVLAGVAIHLLARSGFAGTAFLRWGVVQALFGVVAAIAWLILFSLLSHWLLQLTARCATELPVATAGDLACTVLSLNWEHFERQTPPVPPNESAVWIRLVVLLSSQLQIAPERILPETRLSEDLGLD